MGGGGRGYHQEGRALNKSLLGTIITTGITILLNVSHSKIGAMLMSTIFEEGKDLPFIIVLIF